MLVCKYCDYHNLVCPYVIEVSSLYGVFCSLVAWQFSERASITIFGGFLWSQNPQIFSKSINISNIIIMNCNNHD